MVKLLLFFFIAACIATSIRNKPATGDAHHKEAHAFISRSEKLLRNGDLVLRDYDDPLSTLLKKFSKTDASYSHAGIVMIENSYPFVYHLYTDEKDQQGKIYKDSLKTFCAPEKNKGFGIFRYTLKANERTNLKSMLENWCKRNIRFDRMMDLSTDDAMYCSEFISKLVSHSTNGRIRFSTTAPTEMEKKLFRMINRLSGDVDPPVEIVAIDNLYLNANCIAVKKFIYRP